VSVTVTKVRPEIGAEIVGRSGRDFLDDTVATECRTALAEHGVVVYRDAHLEDPGLLAFSRRLGDVVALEGGLDAYPEISTISLDPARNKVAAVQAGTFLWHIDGTTDDLPYQATLLACRDVSDDGSGDTEFAHSAAAYAALPEAEQADLAELTVTYSFTTEQMRAAPGLSARAHAAYERVPPKVHPLVWTDRRGRKSLLLGSTADCVVGWPTEQGRALLDRLLEWTTQTRFVLRHHWRRGDLVVWDNTGVLHRALPYGPTSRRLLHRTTLAGEAHTRGIS
jgi:alpha-ketoglutarate-dependent taurine dioxygenase